jgi:hypothetical protein
MFKKMTVLAMAVGIVAAMALPATAGASWKHNKVPIQANVQLPFTGTNVKFESKKLNGGLGCQVTSQVQFKAAQTTATAESFKAHPTSDTANCFGTGALAFCQIHKLQPQEGIQWVVHTGAGTTITITHGEIKSEATGAFCPFGADPTILNVSVKAGTVTGTADAHKVSTITLSGQAHVVTPIGEDNEATVSGLLHLEQAPTYEI